MSDDEPKILSVIWFPPPMKERLTKDPEEIPHPYIAKCTSDDQP
jgi:hypothetical protein